MIIEEYLKYRDELLDQSKDDEGFTNQSLLLSQILPSMLDAKLIDSEDSNNSYFSSHSENMKVNAYCVNESGERLQLFMIDEKSIDLGATKESLMISTKSHYDGQFKRVTKFLNKAYKNHLNDEIQDSNPARALISQISSALGAHQFDVVEVFVISTTATVSLQGAEPQPKRIDFESEEITVKYTRDRERVEKQVLIKKRLIDLNFLYNVVISQGNREVLKVDFASPIEVLKAADEEHFESYLCVLPAIVLAGLYKEHSTRLLEKNVRSFLQFKGVNKGIRETIKKEPGKFVAYNNGLTITATEGVLMKESGRTYIHSLTDFQIVNGGQTTATIYFSQKDGFDISQVKVMAKINVAKETTDEELEELISNISTFSNAQSRVSKVDLRARNPQLVRIKSLSESVLTPSGLKWFFERVKGDFSTKMRIAGSNKNRLKKEYPNERRFSKEQLAKYSSAWGEQPYMVKKGGEKVFRYFIEELSGEGSFKKPIDINRNYYEELIGKIYLFRRLEKIYGQGKNSMGQLRSAVVPYSISVLHKFTNGNRSADSFDLLKIWLNEGLPDDLDAFFEELLTLVNELVKKYAKSDDFGEYSKKPQLWEDISGSKEVKDIMGSVSTIKLLAKFSISKADLKERHKSKSNEVDFKELSDNVTIHVNGKAYYQKISALMSGDMTKGESMKLAKLSTSISTMSDLNESDIEYESSLVNGIRSSNPEYFDQLPSERDLTTSDTLFYVVKKYNQALSNGNDVAEEFDNIGTIAHAKKSKYASVFGQIGASLKQGDAPTIKQLYYASHYILGGNTEKPKGNTKPESVDLSLILVRRMVEWEAPNKILSPKERQYVADLAYGFKAMNSFHEKNLRRHLKTLLSSGFTLAD